jgi:hypothetical protein
MVLLQVNLRPWTEQLDLLTQLTAAADVDWSQRRRYVKPRTDHHHHGVSTS